MELKADTDLSYSREGVTEIQMSVEKKSKGSIRDSIRDSPRLELQDEAVVSLEDWLL